MINSLGLILNILGVILISLHVLYEYGISVLLKLWTEEESINNKAIIKNIEEKFRNKNKLTPLEKEQYVQLVKDALTPHLIGIIVMIWLWINKYIFLFDPWINEKEREVNRFLWNFTGLFLILLGFVFQFISTFL